MKDVKYVSDMREIVLSFKYFFPSFAEVKVLQYQNML